MTGACREGMRRSPQIGAIAKFPGNAPEHGAGMAEHGGVSRNMHE